MSNNYAPVPIIDRMSAILDKVISQPNGVSASSLLHDFDIPKTTLYRLLISMTQNKFLNYYPKTNTYSIGSKFLTTYVALDERAGRIREISLPFLRQLAAQAQETVKLSVLSGMRSYTIATVEGPRPIRISINLGAIFPLHAGATGKILMLSLSEEDIHTYCEQYAIRYTDNTIMSEEGILAELETIRRQGYAIDHGEYMDEICAVACPILGENGEILAAISVAYPAVSLSKITEERLAELIQQTSRLVSGSIRNRKAQDQPARLVGETII